MEPQNRESDGDDCGDLREDRCCWEEEEVQRGIEDRGRIHCSGRKEARKLRSRWEWGGGLSGWEIRRVRGSSYIAIAGGWNRIDGSGRNLSKTAGVGPLQLAPRVMTRSGHRIVNVVARRNGPHAGDGRAWPRPMMRRGERGGLLSLLWSSKRGMSMSKGGRYDGNSGEAC